MASCLQYSRTFTHPETLPALPKPATRYLQQPHTRSVYYSLTCSHLQYAIGVWGVAGKTALKRLNVLHNKVLRAMTYSSYKSRVSPLYKNLNLLKINDIYILEIGKFMHNFHWGRIPINFDHLFASVNQAHSHATRAATRGGYIWQLASTVKGKRSLKHLGQKIWDSIDSSLYDISPPAFKKQLKDKLINEYSD